ncbi:MAG: hypothetical protein NT016_01755 [Candidatus Aenigmarchaeota archaeon]|nr:hypothetical protein [Candidatus Aenigmarchaeota archaeon]
MVLRMQKLRDLCAELQSQGFTDRVPERPLFLLIMERFGASLKMRKEISEAVEYAGFMHNLRTGWWIFTGEFAPAPIAPPMQAPMTPPGSSPTAQPMPEKPPEPPALPEPGAPGGEPLDPEAEAMEEMEDEFEESEQL